MTHTTPPAPEVDVSGLRHTLPDGRELFRGVDVQVQRGEAVVLLGPSGCGKSTLLRMIAGLEDHDSGSIRLRGRPAESARSELAVVFQEPLLFPWLRVRDNVLLSARFKARRDRVDLRHSDDLLRRFGIAELVDKFPRELSGGQAQRVAVARAATSHPSLLLLDEPFSALDPVTRAELQAWLVDISDELGLTTVLVTHDVDEALIVGSRVVILGTNGVIQRTWDNPHRGGAGAGASLREEILGSYKGPEWVI